MRLLNPTQSLPTAVLATLLLAGFCLFVGTPKSVHAQRDNSHSVAGESDRQIELVVPAIGGVVRWHDVADAVATSMTLDANAVRQMLPSGSIDLRSDAMVLMLMGINVALGDSLSVDVVRDANQQPALRLRCRRDAFAGAKPAATSIKTTISFDKDWLVNIDRYPLVVCIHGMKGRPETFDAFREYLRKHGIATAAARYDDNDSISQSAARIAAVTKSHLQQARLRHTATDNRELRRGAPSSADDALPRVAFVGHSMGGLVAREIVENPDIEFENVSHLFTVATPHLGSNWASLPPMLNLLTESELNPEDLIDILMHQPTSQGLIDMQPGSDQLVRMASRPRHPGVSYTSIVGTGSPVRQADVDALRETLNQLDRNGSFVRLIRPRIRPLLENFDELVQGLGDGVVSVKNAELRGVVDVVTVPLEHGEMFSTLPRQTNPVWDAICNRMTANKLSPKNSQTPKTRAPQVATPGQP
tara:strand:- start:173473 stop:174894 length:1422 start_codon:yes stop_codon:yes gene_type:complete